MLQFAVASGVIAGAVFPNYIMSVFFGSDLGIVFSVKNIQSETPHTVHLAILCTSFLEASNLISFALFLVGC